MSILQKERERGMAAVLVVNVCNKKNARATYNNQSSGNRKRTHFSFLEGEVGVVTIGVNYNLGTWRAKLIAPNCYCFTMTIVPLRERLYEPLPREASIAQGTL